MPQDFKSTVFEGVLDLSLKGITDLTEYIKEIATIKKIHTLDLSNNDLETLPDSISSLTNIYMLDLSKNKLKCLPESFGLLKQVKHLDLWGNKLTTLPLSFCNLTNLKWLDLKDNPLESKLKDKAGPCLDDKECQDCAKQVVNHIKVLNLEKEKQLEKAKAKEKEKESLKRIQELAMKDKLKQEKKVKKEKQKLEKAKIHKAKPTLPTDPSYSDDEGFDSEITVSRRNGTFSKSNNKKLKTSGGGGGGLSYCVKFLCLVLAAALCCCMVAFSVFSLYAKGDVTAASATAALPLIKEDLIKTAEDSFKWCQGMFRSTWEQLKSENITWSSIHESVREMVFSSYSGCQIAARDMFARGNKLVGFVETYVSEGRLYVDKLWSMVFDK